ncbi:MAG: sigma-70 family RNA polymerase sigma factor, partial [Nannocystaceae bacterium]
EDLNRPVRLNVHRSPHTLEFKRRVFRTEHFPTYWTYERVQRAANGDRRLRKYLFRQLVPIIRDAASWQLGRLRIPKIGDTRIEQDDVITEVAAKLLEHDARVLRRWDPARGKTLKGFIRMVTQRHVLTLIYRANRRAFPVSEFTDIDEKLAARPSEPDQLQDPEKVQLLREVGDHLLASVSPRDRQMFELWLEGWRSKEIGRLLDLKENTVTRQLGRLRDRLRQWSVAFTGDTFSSS